LKITKSEGIEIPLKLLYRHLPDTPLRKPSRRTEGRLLTKEKEMQVFERKILSYSQAVKGKMALDMALEGRRIDKISGICHFLPVKNFV
jgi:hypothetical protein